MYTMQDWQRDGNLKLTEGQLVSKEVVKELLSSVPPITYRCGMFQPGEAHSHDKNFQPLYRTFMAVKEGWEYVGLRNEIN